MEQVSVRMMKVNGFSLIEILIVVAILVVLLVLTIPATNSVLEANKVAEGGRLLSGEVETARQLASVRNRTIEVRLIEKDGKLTTLQLWWPDGVPVSASKAMAFPSPLVILESNDLSPLLSITGVSHGMMPAESLYAGSPYTAFRIRASGVVEPLPTSANRARFYLTIAPDRMAGDSSPDNYATVQINPDTGRTMIYRP